MFQQKNLVLSQVNLQISPREFVYLIGRTGSGKSSFLKLLYGELPLLQGTGQVAGFQLNSLKEKEIPFLRRKLGIVFQDFQLLPDRSSRENLVFVLKAIICDGVKSSWHKSVALSMEFFVSSLYRHN